MRAPLLAPLSLAMALAGLAACFEPVDGGACRRDSDCPGAVCSNVGECASATYRLRVGWTVRGATANTPGACDGVAELELIVSDPSMGQQWSVRPVRCSIGSLLFDKLPLAYGTVAVTAYGERGETLTSVGGSTDPETGRVDVDLRF